MKIAIPLAILAALIAAVIWIAEVRVVVIQPIGAIPDGVTAIVAGVGGVRLIDSPDAICARREGGVSLLCRGTTAAAIAKKGSILVRLPYSDMLFRWTGGPFRD